MEKLEEKIHAAIGAASMCWSELPHGRFQDVEAKKIATDLINDMHNHYDPVEAVKNQIKKDEELFAVWRNNIAKSFKDLVIYNHTFGGKPITALDPDLVHNLANQAATNFLNLLCDIKPEEVGNIPHLSGE